MQFVVDGLLSWMVVIYLNTMCCTSSYRSVSLILYSLLRHQFILLFTNCGAPRFQIGREEYILRQWLDVCVTEGGITVAQQKLHKRPLLVAQMLEEWLNHYRRLE